MFKKIKITYPEDKIFISADFHFSHNKTFIYEKRGFKTIEEHDRRILSDLNAYIAPDDHLIYLGDFAMRMQEQKIEEIFKRISCQNIYYVWGNHDKQLYNWYKKKVFRNVGFECEVYPFQIGNVTFVGRTAAFQINKQDVEVSHYAHMIWNKSHRNVPIISGHSHGSNPWTQPNHKEHGKNLDLLKAVT